MQQSYMDLRNIECPFGYTNTPHKDKKDTFNEKTMKEDINCLRSLKSGKVSEYIEKVKRHFGIGVPTTCAYQYCGDTSNLNIAAMFVQLIFAFDLLHNSVHYFFAWTFVHLAAWGAGGGREEAKVTANNRREGYI